MSPINKRALWLAVPLVAGACGGGRGDAATSTSPTVDVGGVLDAFPATSPPPTTAAATTSVSPSSTSSSSTTSTTEPGPFSWADALGITVEEAPPTELLRDGTGQVRLRVPREWGERSTVGNGEAPYLAASPDLQEFLDGYEEPGLTVVVLPTSERPADALAAYEFGECADGGRRRYESGDTSGVYQLWQDCAGTDTDIVTMTIPSGDETAVLLAQLVAPADVAALDEAFRTLRF